MCRPKPNRFVLCGMPLRWKQARVRIILKNGCIIRLSGRSSYSSVNNVWWIRCWAKRMSGMTILMQHSKVFISFTTLNGHAAECVWTSSLVIYLYLPIYSPFVEMLSRTMVEINGISLSPLIVMQFVCCSRPICRKFRATHETLFSLHQLVAFANRWIRFFKTLLHQDSMNRSIPIKKNQTNNSVSKVSAESRPRIFGTTRIIIAFRTLKRIRFYFRTHRVLFVSIYIYFVDLLGGTGIYRRHPLDLILLVRNVNKFRSHIAT